MKACATCKIKALLADEEYEEDDMMEMPSGKDVKVKVLKLDGSNVHEMMNKILGG
jgi:hypothetical protein